MAGNKINTKGKGKDEKSKGNKGTIQGSEESEENDFSLLRKPILTSITGFAQASKIFDMATEELKGLLANECDLLYECKVCRNIFRSLANFISHKRVYCKETFNSSVHGHFIKPASTISELLKIKRLEEDYHDSLNNKEDEDIDQVDERIPLTKDLTTIVEKISKSKGVYDTENNQQVILEQIPSSTVAVFQNVTCCEKDSTDKMKAQVKELDNLLSRDKAVLQSDGKFKIRSTAPIDKATDNDNVIQISDDDDNDGDILKCKMCDLQFSTQKTLKFHMKYKHLESRLVYPCPDCLEIFSTSWSVYRHLFKVHRKTAAQIRRLRESIQSKAFRMNNPPAFYEKRKNNMKAAVAQKISEEERLEQENQAWMDNMEGDGELPRCGGCGRTFERRAALAAHTHTCQPRSRALSRRPQETKKIEIQIRKDYNKGPSVLNVNLKTADANENKLPKEDPQSVPESQKEIEKNDNSETLQNNMDIDEDDKSNDSLDSAQSLSVKNKIESYKPTINLPFAQHLEINNIVSLKQKILNDVEVKHLQCKKCDLKLETVQELYDHMADHYKWLRYACKLCNFKHYQFEKLPEHVKIVHKLKGDSDFYYSTVKAIDGNKALELCDPVEEPNEETSPDFRPSRCSSDSSRLSDDSSSSSTKPENVGRKRKMNPTKIVTKKRRDIDYGDDQKDDSSTDKEMNGTIDNETLNTKIFEENSSDLDDIEDKLLKRPIIEHFPTVTSRRPVRKRTRPKNEDFEYDLSNLLKMEAQGYRESQTVTTTKNNPTKKKPHQEPAVNYDSINKDCCGALATLSKKAVESNKAHMRICNFAVFSTLKEIKPSNIFVRPMIPRIISRAEKISPRKDISDDVKESSSLNKAPKLDGELSHKDINDKNNMEEISNEADKDNVKPARRESVEIVKEKAPDASEKKDDEKKSSNASKPSVPTVVPIKFRRQSLEVMSNPIINKNITDFTKAGMKTKILVIKPINRNKEVSAINSSLKFQTIKLRDPNKSSTNNKDKSDQVVVVKVPKVECTTNKPKDESFNKSNDKLDTSLSALSTSKIETSKEDIERPNDESCSKENTKLNVSDVHKSEAEIINNEEAKKKNVSCDNDRTLSDICQEGADITAKNLAKE